MEKTAENEENQLSFKIIQKYFFKIVKNISK